MYSEADYFRQSPLCV